eukprot:jgi/Mesvir1/19756/Mv25378-RA.1
MEDPPQNVHRLLWSYVRLRGAEAEAVSPDVTTLPVGHDVIPDHHVQAGSNPRVSPGQTPGSVNSPFLGQADVVPSSLTKHRGVGLKDVVLAMQKAKQGPRVSKLSQLEESEDAVLEVDTNAEVSVMGSQHTGQRQVLFA